MAEEDLGRDRRDPAPPETQAVRTRPFFSPRKLEKVYLSQFRHKRRRPITFSSRNVSTRIFDPPPSNLFAPSRNLPIPLSPPLFFPSFFSSDHLDEWIHGSKRRRGAFLKQAQFHASPLVFFRRRRMRTISRCANSFLPRGWMDRNFAERNGRSVRGV